MENEQDFVIKKGVLTKYNGPGGDVTIPEGVKGIGGNAFRYCASLTSAIIPEGVTEIGKDVFEVCIPMLAAPHISIVKFDEDNKPGACVGFARAYLDGWEIDAEIKAGYLKYIKRQRKRLFPETVQYEELLRVMLAEKMLDHKDIDLLLDECGQQNNIAAKVAVLDYAGRNLKPVDLTKEFKLKGL